MKIKSLLISAALMTGMCAAAQSVSAPNLTIDENNVGTPIEIPLTLTMPDGGDYTNIEVHFQFAEGMKPCFVDGDAYFEGQLVETEDTEVGMYCCEGADVVTKRGIPVVSYKGNFDVADRWPYYTVVGANITKVANTTNPNHFLTIFAKFDKVEGTETYPVKVYVKYTQFDDQSFTVGEEENMVDLCNVTYNFPISAVADVNAAKAVSSVKYYNAAGVASDNAFEGVNIVVTKYADGSQSVTKVVK